MTDVYKTASYLGKKAKTESGTAFNGGYVTRSMPSSFVFFFFLKKYLVFICYF